MLIPHGSDRVRSLQLSGSRLRAAITMVVVALVGFGSMAAWFGKPGQHFRAQQLERENLLLAAEVTELREQMEELSASIEKLSEKDEKYRTMAGLDSIDEDVRRVGIGGPGTQSLETLEIYQHNQELGEQVFAASYDLGTLTRRAALLSRSLDEALVQMQENTERLAAIPTIAPSDGPLSSLFSRSRRHPVLRITRPHEGIDIAARVGEPILAPAGGKVRFAGTKPGGYGLTVELDHGFGYATRFAHASRLLVRVGQTVERGETIAEVGATGLVTGPHLHYEIEHEGVPVDPLNFIITDTDALPD